MGGKIEKSHGGTPPGVRGSAPASVRRLRQDTPQKNPRYSAKSTLLSQKQRRYECDIDVYAKIVEEVD